MPIDPNISLMVQTPDLAGMFARAQQAQADQEERKYRLGALLEQQEARRAQATREQQAERAQDLAAAVRWAQTPEQWAQVQRIYGQEGMDLSRYPFEAREQALLEHGGLRPFMESAQSQGVVDWETIPGVGIMPVDPRTRLPVDIRSVMGGGAPATPAPSAPSPQASAPSAAPANDYATGVASTLSAAGVPAPVIAGILANGHYESGGWNIQNSGDNGTAHGAFQWRNERADNFRRITGADPRNATPEQTARFVLWELQNPQAAGMTPEQARAILSARSPQEAAILFSRHYERPDPRMANNSRRIALAGQYAGTGPTPSGGGSSAFQQIEPYIIRGPTPPPPGFEAAPGGGIQPVRGSQPEYERQRDVRQERREASRDWSALQREFRSDPEVRQFNAARTATLQIRTLGQSGTAADDIAIVFGFMRALDPNSTVREGEFATAQNSAGIPDRVRNYYNQMLQGTRLTPRQRNEMIATAGRLYTDRARVYNEHVDGYRRQAVDMGVSPQQVGRAFQTARAPAAADARRQQQRRSGGRTSQGVRYRVIGG